MTRYEAGTALQKCIANYASELVKLKPIQILVLVAILSISVAHGSFTQKPSADMIVESNKTFIEDFEIYNNISSFPTILSNSWGTPWSRIFFTPIVLHNNTSPYPIYLLSKRWSLVHPSAVHMDTVIPASKILSKIAIGASVECDNVIIVGDMDIRKMNLLKDIDEFYFINSPVNITCSEILGDVNFSNVVFQKTTNFSGTQFNADSNFENAWFVSNVCFSSAQFIRNVKFFDVQFRRYADFTSAQFSGNADFTSAEFKKDTKFLGAQFSRSANFTDAQFDGNADFTGVKFNKDAKFSDAKFSGLVNLMDAQFSENADFMGAQFNGELLGKIWLKLRYIYGGSNFIFIGFVIAIFAIIILINKLIFRRTEREEPVLRLHPQRIVVTPGDVDKALKDVTHTHRLRKYEGKRNL